MIARLFRRGSSDSAIPTTLYGAIVAGARNPVLYRDFGVADTVDGRFESVVLHCVLALRRFGGGDAEMRATGQAVFDLFCTEMDRSLREMGVGDLAVPKRMRKIGEVFYGRSAAFDSALANKDAGALAESLERNMPAAEGQQLAVAALASYMLASDAALAAADKDRLMKGELPFADPAAFLQDGRDEGQDPAGKAD
ncbi:MAG: ubiquinol-cytochrome C chaperone [Bauldia sp.]|nr:ubiquinol-cytochrome C chaperone [Bauldia sp.]